MSAFIDIPGNPAPAGATCETFAAADGAILRTGFFPVENARGTVVLMTGWSEFIEKFFETICDLQSRGFNVAMMDWRGQGLSDRESCRAAKWRGYFRTIADDLKDFFEQKVKPRFNGPYVLMTHSMGGLPALLLLSTGYEGFSRAVLSAPMTRLFPEPQAKMNGRLSAFLSAIGFANTHVPRPVDHADVFEGNIFTTDKARHTMFRDLKLAEPKAASTSPTFGWVREASRESDAIHAPGALSGVKIPVLIVRAGAEKQVDGADQEEIAARSDMLSLEIVPGALHEMMMERDSIRALYFNAFDKFVAPIFQA